MKSRLDSRTVGRNIALSISAQAVSVAVSMIFNFIVPKYIDVGQFAYWQTYILYVSYVGILHFGLLDGILLRYSEYDYEDLDKRMMRSQFRSLLLITSALAIVGLAVSGLVQNSNARIITALVAVGIVTKNLFTYNLYALQITNRFKEYAVVVMAQRIAFGLIVIALLLAGCDSFVFYCCADLAGDLAGCLVAAFFNHELYFGDSFKGKQALRETSTNIATGSMLLISNWVALLFVSATRLIVQWYWSLEDFGKVSYAFSLTNLFLVFMGSISVVVFPSIKRTDQESFPAIYSSVRWKLSMFMLSLMLLYFPLRWLLSLWLPQYTDSISYLGLLFPMVVFSSTVSLLTNNFLNAYRKEKQMLAVNLTSIAFLVAGDIVIAFTAHDLDMIVLWTLAVIIIRSILAESRISAITGLNFTIEHVVEILASVAFVLCATRLSIPMGALSYFLVLAACAAFGALKNRKAETR